jgi:hypothetical protein
MTSKFTQVTFKVLDAIVLMRLNVMFSLRQILSAIAAKKRGKRTEM